MKRKEFLKQVKSLSRDELKEKSRSIAEELMKLRFRKISGQVEQSSRFRSLRRDLARIQTQLNSVKA